MAPGRAIPTPIMIPDLPGMASPVQAPVQVPIGGSAPSAWTPTRSLSASDSESRESLRDIRPLFGSGFLKKKNGNLNLTGGTGPGNPISRVTSINCSGRAPGESAEYTSTQPLASVGTVVTTTI